MLSLHQWLSSDGFFGATERREHDAQAKQKFKGITPVSCQHAVANGRKWHDRVLATQSTAKDWVGRATTAPSDKNAKLPKAHADGSGDKRLRSRSTSATEILEILGPHRIPSHRPLARDHGQVLASGCGGQGDWGQGPGGDEVVPRQQHLSAHANDLARAHAPDSLVQHLRGRSSEGRDV